MKLLGYDEETLKKNIQANKHNDMTTMFLLLSFLINIFIGIISFPKNMIERVLKWKKS